MGSGSTLVAAALLDRRYIGYDLDAGYVDMARRRVAEAIADVSTREHAAGPDGDTALRLAELALGDAGFTITGRNRRVPQTGVTVGFVAEDDARDVWRFEVCGPNTTYRGGMAKVDVAWRALGRAAAIGGAHDAHGVPLVLLTTALPASGEAVTALRAAGPGAFFDVIDLASDDDADRLQRYAKGGYTADPQPGFWTDAELGRPAH
jgi:site-specific DNA-methyltransferase (adenine-specific)